MGVYLYQNGTEKELKNAYVGQVYEYSYDFTTGSVADLQSKGWTVPTGSVVDSNGYYNSSRNWDGMTLVDNNLATACQNAKKLVFSFTWSATGTHQRFIGLKKISVSAENVYFYGDGIVHTGGNQARFGGEQLLTESTQYGDNGTYTSTMTVDIVNKTWQIEMTDHSTLSGTVTDTAISTFRNCDGISIYGERYAYIKSFSVNIE